MFLHGVPRKAFQETHAWEVVRGKIRRLPQVPRVPSLSIPLWKKPNVAYLRPRSRASVQAFLRHGSVPVPVVIWPVQCAPCWRGLPRAPGGGCRENTRMNGARACYWARQRKGALSLLGFGFIVSGWGRTTCFFILTSQLPTLSQASDVSTL